MLILSGVANLSANVYAHQSVERHSVNSLSANTVLVYKDRVLKIRGSLL